MKPRYSIVIQWSDEDDCYVVTLPEFAEGVMQPCADGSTYEEAFQKALEVLELLIEDYQADGTPLPEPRTLQVA